MQLLVSVTDALEAREAVEGGADIIDVKDPRTGALGAATRDVMAAVRAATPSPVPMSAALGDGPFRRDAAALAALVAAEHGAAFVKLGLRSTSAAHAVRVLSAVRSALPAAVRLVVAGFADAERAGAPAPHDVPAIAAAAGAEGCLLDTAIKDGRGLLHWLDVDALARFVTDCRARGLLSALAGSLTATDLETLAVVSPDVVGVRSAACGGDRLAGRVSRQHVARLARRLGPVAAPPGG